MARSGKLDVSALRNDAQNALERGKLDKAIEIYAQLEEAEPSAPAWPKRIGETHRRAGNDAAAVTAFERAAQKYALEGFLVQAIAVCKLILQIDPEHSTTQARLASWMPQPAEQILKPAPELELDDDDIDELAPPRPAAMIRGATQALPRLGSQAERSARPERPPVPASSRTQPLRLDPRPPATPVDARRPAVPASTRTQPLPLVARPPAELPRIDIPSEQRLPRPVPMRPPGKRQKSLTERPSTRAAWTETPVGEGKPETPRARRASRLTLRPEVAVRVEVEVATDRVRRPTPMQPRGEPSAPAIIIDKVPTIELPPGSGLDSIDLSTLIPGTTPMMRSDGTFSGVNVLLGDLELSLDDAEPIADSGPSPAARKALMTTPLFPQMPPALLEMLIGRMNLVELDPGQVLFHEGDVGTELFVISEGEVAVSSGGNPLATLGPSAFFGEIALVTDLPRSATIKAVTRVELLGIDRELIREAAAEHREIVTVLLKFVRDRLIDRITRTSELFAPFSEGERESLSGRFELVEVVPDAVLITQGERADGLYLVVAGKVEVWRNGQSALATLGSGDVFGELSLMSNSGSMANVRSLTRVLALRMPASTFREVIMTHPQVLAYLGDLAERRAPRSEGEPFVDLHVDLLV